MSEAIGWFVFAGLCAVIGLLLPRYIMTPVPDEEKKPCPPPRCETCKFFRDHYGDGQCAEDSPSMSENGNAQWPTVQYDMFCGRWEPKDG